MVAVLILVIVDVPLGSLKKLINLLKLKVLILVIVDVPLGYD